MDPKHQTMLKAIARHVDELMSLPNVVRVAVAHKFIKGKEMPYPCISVGVEMKCSTALLPQGGAVPKEWRGHITDVVRDGVITAPPALNRLRGDSYRDLLKHNPQTRMRPIHPGCSIAHEESTAGTLGAIVRCRATDALLFLTNCHVAALSGAAQERDPILQPGPYDGGKEPADRVAQLWRFLAIRFLDAPAPPMACPWFNRAVAATRTLTSNTSTRNKAAKLLNLAAKVLHRKSRASVEVTNTIDAAVCYPSVALDVNYLGIGTPYGGATIESKIGLEVVTSGRTAPFVSQGRVIGVGATVDIGYGEGRTARFVDQVLFSPISQPGDSGSLIMSTPGLYPVALLFAGSDQLTIGNPIQAVLDGMDVRLV
ncbi:unnamed protein product [marine sediment metagenome]|uniref:Uncharacterized protein n=1 Tax=marine sediment metagenome TaxID=412755 RepID=X0U724_9ZZZZ